MQAFHSLKNSSPSLTQLWSHVFWIRDSQLVCAVQIFQVMGFGVNEKKRKHGGAHRCLHYEGGDGLLGAM
jgi:hypothetical protein